ncbi:Putative phosphatase, partial [Giardia duodenalis]
VRGPTDAVALKSMVLAGPLENPGYHLPYSDRMLSHDCVDHAGEASSAPSPSVTQLPHLVHVHPVDNRGHLDQEARGAVRDRRQPWSTGTCRFRRSAGWADRHGHPGCPGAGPKELRSTE